MPLPRPQDPGSSALARGIDGADAFDIAAVCDGAINVLTNLGMRFYPMHGDSNFPAVRAEMIGRAQRALDLLAQRVGARGSAGGPLCGATWSFADIAVYTTVTWLEGLPVRAKTFPPAKQVAELGWTLPPLLSAWADQHRQRKDVLALD